MGAVPGEARTVGCEDVYPVGQELSARHHQLVEHVRFVKNTFAAASGTGDSGRPLDRALVDDQGVRSARGRPVGLLGQVMGRGVGTSTISSSASGSGQSVGTAHRPERYSDARISESSPARVFRK